MIIGKLENALKMAMLLQSRGKMKGYELAQELDVTERQILKYKNALEEAGIMIDSKQGAHGGYTLLGSNLLGLKIDKNEIFTLEMIKEQLIYNNDMNKDEFINILDKLKVLVNSNSDSNDHMDYFTIQPKSNIDTQKQKKIYKDIIYAYITKRKIKMNYYSLASGEKERIVHPYGMFNYKGDIYMVAYCENRENFADFKICRISQHEVLDEKYNINSSFSWSEYSKNCMGIYKDGEFEVVLKIKYPFSIIIKEKIWVDNQKIIENKDKSIIFKATMKGYSEIKSWILSMGADVEVIEPEKLREDIISEVEKIKNLY
ncbi:helix-turn-helix transcriptional regulator [Terrisporobacter sp.]